MASGSQFYSYGKFTNGLTTGDSAQVYLNAGATLYLSNGGLFQTGTGSKLKIYGSVQNYPGQSSTITLGNPGDAAGSGGFIGGEANIGTAASPIHLVNNAGTADPGDPANFTIFGDYTQGLNGALDLNIDGPGGPGVGNDRFVVNGNVTLDGTLDLIIGKGYKPTGLYDLLEFTGTLTGGFSTVEETIGGNTINLQGSLIYGPSGISFQPAATPEPAPWLAVGGGAFVLLRRRRKAVCKAG